MGIGHQKHTCMQTDCEASFDVKWEEATDDWPQGDLASLKHAPTIGWQAVSLPGKLRFLCPLHHDPNAPTR